MMTNESHHDGDSFSEEALGRLNRVCDEFTKALRANEKCHLEDYLTPATNDDERRWLFRHLLHEEVHYRREIGDPINAEGYYDEFRSYRNLIDQVILSCGDQTKIWTPGSGQPEKDESAISRIGNYEIVRELGRGGMGTVYEAIQLSSGRHIALKLLAQGEGELLHLFMHEFRLLVELSHDNLVRLYDLEDVNGKRFFTMELIKGEDFLKFVRPSEKLNVDRLRSAVTQLAQAVKVLHDRGIVHCDLKPQNVLVTFEDLPRVIVLDFGLAIELNHQSEVSQRIAGTIVYMAPEQWARADVPNVTWDMYAIGVMIFQAITGTPPFVGPLAKVLHDKQTMDLPALPETPNVPKDIVTLCERLLSRDPATRANLADIARTFHAEATPPELPQIHLEGLPLIEREKDLSALRDGLRAARGIDEPTTMFISALSGEGKSALVECFLAPLRDDERLTVISARCYERESVPFKSMENLIDKLCSFLRSLSDVEAALLVPRDISLLARIFPVMRRVKVIADAPATKISGLNKQEVKHRAWAALRTLVRAIADHSQVILFIDDLQWGDADSASVLFEMLRPPDAPAVLFLGAYRSDQVETSPFLNMWNSEKRKHDVAFEHRDVCLGPLNNDECYELVKQLSNEEVAKHHAPEFAREAVGNPMLLIELVDSMLRADGSFHFLPLHTMLAQKLTRLCSESDRLLEVLAVAGQAILLEELCQTAGHDSVPQLIIDGMQKSRLVRLSGSNDRRLADTYHDRIREVVLEQMEPGPRAATHRKLATLIEQNQEGEDHAVDPNPRVYDLAYHFDKAGDKQKARIYALRAAGQARGQFAFEVAAEQYAIAVRNIDNASEAVRFRIAEEYGETLMLSGHYQEALAQLEGVESLSDNLADQARICAIQGEISFKQGRLVRSSQTYESALRKLRTRVPKTSWGFRIALLREALVQSVHSALGKKRKPRPTNATASLTVRLLSRLQYPFWFQSTVKCLWAHMAAMNRAERDAPEFLAFNYAVHAIAMSMIGWHKRGLRYADKALELRHQLGDVWLQGHSLAYKGLGLYSAGRYHEALECLATAKDLYVKTGDLWEENLAAYHAACCHYRLGNHAQAINEARQTFEVAVRMGEDAMAHYAIDVWSKAAQGDLPFDQLKRELSPLQEDIQSTCQLHQAEGNWHLFHDRTQEALESFRRAFRLAKDNVVVNFHTVPALPSYVRALRLRADAEQSGDNSFSRKTRRRSLRLSKWACRLTRLFPPEHPSSLRELSLLLAQRGRKPRALRKALKYATKSRAAADKQQAKFESAQSLLLCGQIGLDLDLANAKDLISQAESMLDSIKRPSFL
jgi:serine/threonine protein kinase/tetratricopeptide (TPR) repeat protein